MVIDFGDGSSVPPFTNVFSTLDFAHTYPVAAGPYVITVTVTDVEDLFDSVVVVQCVEDPPPSVLGLIEALCAEVLTLEAAAKISRRDARTLNTICRYIHLRYLQGRFSLAQMLLGSFLSRVDEIERGGRITSGDADILRAMVADILAGM